MMTLCSNSEMTFSDALPVLSTINDHDGHVTTRACEFTQTLNQNI